MAFWEAPPVNGYKYGRVCSQNNHNNMNKFISHVKVSKLYSFQNFYNNNDLCFMRARSYELTYCLMTTDFSHIEFVVFCSPRSIPKVSLVIVICVKAFQPNVSWGSCNEPLEGAQSSKPLPCESWSLMSLRWCHEHRPRILTQATT